MIVARNFLIIDVAKDNSVTTIIKCALIAETVNLHTTIEKR